MEHQKHERFHSANHELCGFLRWAEGVAKGNCTISDGDLETLLRRLSNRDFSIGEASRSETLDAELRSELAEYIHNFRAIQSAIDKVRSVRPALRRPLKTANPQFWELDQ